MENRENTNTERTWDVHLWDGTNRQWVYTVKAKSLKEALGKGDALHRKAGRRGVLVDAHHSLESLRGK